MSILIIGILVKLLVKLAKYIFKLASTGEQLPADMRARVEECLWVMGQIQAHAAQVGCNLTGQPPSEWYTENLSLTKDESEAINGG